MKKQLLLAFYLAVLCLAQGVWAQKPDISWFAKNPDADTFYIATANGLAGLAQLVNNAAGLGQAVDFKGKKIVLTTNINLSVYGAKYNDKKGWIPIGYGNSFSGIFDGNGKTVSGLYIAGDFASAGLFGIVNGGEIKRLGVTNVNITASVMMGNGVGGIAGELLNSNITDCFSSGTINSSTRNANYRDPQSYTGGIVGKIINGNITNSYSLTTIKGDYGIQIGGVVGCTNENVNVTNSYSTGTLNGDISVGGVVGYVGGVVGNVGSCFGNGCKIVVTNSYSTGTINGGKGVGGVLGYVSGNSWYGCKVVITNSFSTGNISGRDGVGGILGTGTDCNRVINNSFSTGNISGSDDVGGIAGRCEKVSNSYSTGAVSGNNTVGGVVGYAGEVNNNYSTGAISGKNYVGGIVGNAGSKIKSNVALNSSVKSTGAFSRVVGNVKGELSNNAAFNEMTNNTGTALWLSKSALEKNGVDITKEYIYADSTLGGRFTPENGWIVENGKLPGFGKAVNMPKHLSLSAAKQAEVIQKKAAGVYQIGNNIPLKSSNNISSESHFTDPRDNKEYKIVKIGTQTWMAENLNYDAPNSKCYDNSPANCDKHGRLYDWNTATRSCPSGWHLPSDNEWEALTASIGDEKTAGKFLKATNGWTENGNGTDDFGFSALPSGSSGGYFNNIGNHGNWWSASENDANHAYSRGMYNDYEGIARHYNNKSYTLFSVRCLQD